MFKPSCIPSIVAVSLVIVAWAGAVQGQIIDFGGDYVSSDTALTSGVKFTSPNAGTDGVFTPYFLGGTTLTLKDNGTSDSFVVTSGSAGADYIVVWDIPDTSGGGPFSVLDQTSLAAGDNALELEAPVNMPLTKFVVEIDGDFYASTRQKQNGTTKNFNRGEIEGENPDFGLVDLVTLAIDTSGAPGTFIDFADIDDATAAGFFVIANNDREVDGVEVFGQLQTNQQVPEPASIAIWSLIGLGLTGFGYYRTRRR